MGVGCGCLLTFSAFRMSANSRLDAYLSKYGIITGENFIFEPHEISRLFY